MSKIDFKRKFYGWSYVINMIDMLKLRKKRQSAKIEQLCKGFHSNNRIQNEIASRSYCGHISLYCGKKK